MFSFLRRKTLFKRAALAGAVPVLLIGLLFGSCASPESDFFHEIIQPEEESGIVIPGGIQTEEDDSVNLEGIQISSQEDIAKIGVAGTHPLSGTYVLTNNITLTNWTPIGASATPFTGKFNGNRKTITLNGFDSTVLSGNTHLGLFAGNVQGFNNAGGIVGQNQVNTYIRRCYSTAAISVTNQAGTGIGGIAGMNASTQADAITACVALNQSLTAPKGNNINRVTGTTGGNRSNNYGWTNMPINAGTGTYTERKGDTLADGADCAEKPVQSFYSGLGWDFTNVWKMGTDYPKLKWQN